MLLIDDDQARVIEWRENRRARSDHDARIAAQRGHPAGPALADVLGAMRDADQRSEARAKDAHDLIGERDFRHQHQHAPLGRQRLGRKPQINLGLAAGGDAPEQKGFEALLAHRRRGRGDRGGLLDRELERRG